MYCINVDFVVNQQFTVFTLKENYKNLINMEFMKYYFSKISEFCIRNMRKSSVPTVDIDNILRQEIPIPSIKTQEKIVKILEKFTKYATKLETELETELEKRIKQYNHYRDRLLSEEYLSKLSKKLWYKNELIFREYRIEEICEIVAGGDVLKNNFSKEKTEEYNIPVLSNGIEQSSIYGYTNVYRIEKPSITISARGTIGWANLIEEKFYPVVRLLVLTPKDEIDLNIKYLYYYTKVIENDYILPKPGIPQLTKDKVAKIKIYLPSLAIQNKVVKILDKFQEMLEYTKGLLPQEIELRRKQYEYYREKLLTFDSEYARERAW